MGIDLRKLYATDKKKAEEGTWIDLPGGARLKVAQLGNPRYKSMKERLLAPYQRSGRVPKDEQPKIELKLLALLLTDWENVEIDGKPVAFSPKLAEELLGEFEQLRAIVESQSQNFELFRLFPGYTGEESDGAEASSEDASE